jgi:hypothetical protein
MKIGFEIVALNVITDSRAQHWKYESLWSYKQCIDKLYSPQEYRTDLIVSKDVLSRRD